MSVVPPRHHSRSRKLFKMFMNSRIKSLCGRSAIVNLIHLVEFRTIPRHRILDTRHQSQCRPRLRQPILFGHFWPCSCSNFDLELSPSNSTRKKSDIMILECSFPLVNSETLQCDLHRWSLKESSTWKEGVAFSDLWSDVGFTRSTTARVPRASGKTTTSSSSLHGKFSTTYYKW